MKHLIIFISINFVCWFVFFIERGIKKMRNFENKVKHIFSYYYRLKACWQKEIFLFLVCIFYITKQMLNVCFRAFLNTNPFPHWNEILPSASYRALFSSSWLMKSMLPSSTVNICIMKRNCITHYF